MKPLINHILDTFELKKHKKWDKLYWAIDVHETIVRPNYKPKEICTEFYPNAVEALQLISQRKDCCLILFTCSYPEEIKQYLDFFKQHNITFQYVNENPEAKNTVLGCFDKKFYFNFLLDDKTGFQADWDWKDIIMGLQIQEQKEKELITCPTCNGKKEVMISCCTGDVIDDDIAMCPECHEHLGEEECPDCEGEGVIPQNKTGLSEVTTGLQAKAENYRDSIKDQD